eukprot:TRINITY_DN26518_c0_g1_i1.p1 TRINITY_DN26518_c0_g1~~TRINITY_DN26518_c0_g1_i1.p1  ORF type:complete len:174 (-),score=4.81 TRINITY_DN26518_c0_g1_i1:175-696(-)
MEKFVLLSLLLLGSTSAQTKTKCFNFGDSKSCCANKCTWCSGFCFPGRIEGTSDCECISATGPLVSASCFRRLTLRDCHGTNTTQSPTDFEVGENNAAEPSEDKTETENENQEAVNAKVKCMWCQLQVTGARQSANIGGFCSDVPVPGLTCAALKITPQLFILSVILVLVLHL